MWDLRQVLGATVTDKLAIKALMMAPRADDFSKFRYNVLLADREYYDFAHLTQIQQAFDDYQRTQFGGWPWSRRDPVHPRSEGRFAIHADGRVEHRDMIPAG